MSAESKVGVLTWTAEKRGAAARITVGSARVPFAQYHQDATWAERTLGAELKALRAAGVRRLDVLLDSSGGSVAYANGIARALDKWSGRKRLLIDGACHSAATLILCVPTWDDTAITSRSNVMIHRPRVEIFRRGAASGLWRWIGQRQKESTIKIFIKLYMDRTGADRETVGGWMAGKTFNPEQAVAVGLCGRIAARADWEKEGTV